MASTAADEGSTEAVLLLEALPSFTDAGSEGLAKERLRRMRLISGRDSNAGEPASRCDNRETAVVGQKIELVPYRLQHVPQMHQWFMEDEELADTMCGCTTLPQEYRQREKWQVSPEHISFLIASRSDFGQIIGDVHLLFEKDEPNEDEDEGTTAIPPAGDEEPGEVLPPSGAEIPQNLDDWTRENILGPAADGFFHEAEILVMVADPAFRRGGFATEAVVRLMQYGAAVIGARRFIAKIDDSNEASLGLFTNKLGFRVYEKNEDFEMTHVELSGQRLMTSLFDPSFEGGLCAKFGLSSARHDSPEVDAAEAATDQKFMTQTQLDRAKAALDHVNSFKQQLSHPSSSGGGTKEVFEVQPSRFFAEPVDLDYYEGYTDIVARPLDLGKVAENLAKDVYTSPTAFRVDVQTTFSNLLAFNNDPLETRRQFPDPRSCAFSLLDAFQQSYEDYAASFVAETANTPMSLTDKQQCRKQLDVLLLHRTVPQPPAKVSGRKNGKVRTCGPFVVPILSLGLPDYQAKVSRPMDLCHVSNTLNTDGYESPAAFAADVELTFQNALAYGGEIAYEDPDTEVQCLVPALAKVALETWKTLA